MVRVGAALGGGGEGMRQGEEEERHHAQEGGGGLGKHKQDMRVIEELVECRIAWCLSGSER